MGYPGQFSLIGRMLFTEEGGLLDEKEGQL